MDSSLLLRHHEQTILRVSDLRQVSQVRGGDDVCRKSEARGQYERRKKKEVLRRNPRFCRVLKYLNGNN